MANFWILEITFLAVTCCSFVRARKASVTYNHGTEKFTIHDFMHSNSVANATFTDAIFNTGWSYLEVKTSNDFPDTIQAYGAGIVEGYLTADLLKKYWSNVMADYCVGEKWYCKRLKAFLQQNMDFMNVNIKSKRENDVYWHQIALVLEQLKGLEDGYKNITSQPSTQVNVMGLLLLNAMSDMDVLAKVLNKKVTKGFKGQSCSALVKVHDQNRDLYVSHDTWSTYDTMLRVLKKYSFSFHTSMSKDSPVIPGHTSTFSSYPGTIFSSDDFYLISSGLAAMETTIENSNSSLWKFVKPNTILEWLRNIIANRLAKDGKQWTELFGIMNSGTYNNQWMIIDYNKFQPGGPLKDGLLWVLEQLPGHLRSEDMTNVLRKQTYWPSYNVPFFKDIFDLSGSQVNVKKYGEWFSYDKCPRALMFKRGQGSVNSVTEMMKLMRLNDYTNDPLSRCNCIPQYNAANAISSRNDLNPVNGTYPFPALDHELFGGIDMKLTTYSLFKDLEFLAIGGPTYDSVPPFQWSKSGFGKNVKHEGQPDLWKFEPVLHKWRIP